MVFLKMGHSRRLFLYFRLFYLNVQLLDKSLPMLGFEPCISSVGSDCSTNCATTIAQKGIIVKNADEVNFTNPAICDQLLAAICFWLINNPDGSFGQRN